MSLKNISRLKPAEFSYIDSSHGNTEKLTMGIMAQNVNEVWSQEKYSIVKTDLKGNHLVDYYQLIAPMIKAIQELSTKVEELEKKLDK